MIEQLTTPDGLAYQTIVNTSTDAILIIDSAGIIQFANPAAHTMFCSHAQQHLVGSVFGYPIITDNPAELDILCHSGKNTLTAEMQLAAIQWNGQPAYIASLRNITTRKKREEQISFQAQILNSVHQAIITTDINGIITYWNNFARQIYGWTAEEALGRPLAEILPANQTDRQTAEITDKLQQEQSWSGELMVRGKNGAMVPIHSSKSPLYNADGRQIGITNISTDITEFIKAEQLTRKLSRIVEQTADHVIITNYTGRIEYVNPAFEKDVGYTLAEIVGKTPGILKSGEHTREFYLKLWHTIQAGLPFTSVFCNKKKNGQLYFEEKTITPLKDETGTITHFVSTGKDITGQIESKKAIQKYTQRLQVFHQLDQAILNQRSPEAIAHTALLHTIHLVPYNMGSVIEFLDSTNQGRVLTTYPKYHKPYFPNAIISLGGQSTINSLKNGDMIHLNNLTEEDLLLDMYNSLYQQGIRSYLCVPLTTENGLIGTLNLAGNTPNAYTTEHLEIAHQIATSLAIVLQQAQLHQQIQHDTETKVVLLHEVNHRVKNNLAAIIGLLYAEERHFNRQNTGIRSPIRDIIGQVQGLAAAHSMLSAAEWGQLKLSELAYKVVEGSMQILPLNRQIKLHISPSPVEVKPNQANSLALVINELATNTLKYAISDTIIITITIWQNPGHIYLKYQDNGPGYPDSVLQDNITNAGIHLIKNLTTNDLHGNCELLNDHGAVTIIHFEQQD